MPTKGTTLGSFLPFLPHDNADLAVTEATDVIQITNEDLSRLLCLPPAQFWDLLKQDQSLQTCLDTFLQYKRRSFDADAGQGVAGMSAAAEQLSRRVFMVFMRMVTPCQPGSGPTPSQQADILYNCWLLDVPKLMDICVLYGGPNRQLTVQLLSRLFALQPKYAEDVANVVPALVGNINELQERCVDIAHKALASRPDGDGAPLIQELAEAAKYYQDAALTLAAFVEVYPPAASMLLGPGPGLLLTALGSVYEQLLPLLARVGSRAGPKSPALLTGPRLKQCLLLVMWKLLLHGYLTPEGAAGGAAGAGAQAKGQELVSLLMAVAHPAQEGSGSGAAQQGLLHVLNAAYHLDAAVANAMQLGLVTMDDAQFDYLLALMGGSRAHLQSATTAHATATAAGKAPMPSSNASGSGRSAATASADGAPSSSSSSSSAAAAAAVASQVAQIKELLPEYGDGYLAACLHACAYNTEQVINALLEGSPPQAVAGLSPQLQHWSPGTAAAGITASAKGKAAAVPGTAAGGGLSWTGLASEAAARQGAAAAPRAPALTPAPAKAKVDERTARVLGAVSGQLRRVTHALADELQYDYDDEYDDSFDDLISLRNDGVADIEGEDDRPNASRGARGPSPAVAAAASRLADEDEPAGRDGMAASSSSSSSRGGMGSRGAAGGRGGRGGRGGMPKQERLWVLDGKVYNYPKPGAVQVQGQEGAQQALQQAEAQTQEIYGLGPGGNKGVVQQAASTSGSDGESDEAGRGQAGGGGGRGGPGRGGGGRQEGGRGRGRGSYAHKEQHKAAVANHHRKDRALRKAGLL